ncbi:FecR domain-containing protein [Sphingomonas sp. BIUV-7]|uniref:FecR domain-containing protein n=1 Tax=Sphingomonas natans TaxID=3063330 RepID=A0ABT8Y5P0_9SPHN|nr:FecR domain-containing protein [Sphingomonas sp. BIUV-7]MDO6413636.1 FecR domain-containing protein [Sphingomonas sp. BIUV-7]
MVKFAPALALLLGLAAPVFAQAPKPYAASTNAPFAYRVRAGDTLPKIAAAYLTSPNSAAEVQRLNNIGDPMRLAPGTMLALPAALLRTETLSAKIIAFRGEVSVGQQGPARVGMVFGEGIRIATGANASVAFQLTDGTAVTLPSLSTVRIVRLRKVLVSNRVQRVLALEAGRTESQVTPSKDGSTSFEIRTPVSVAAVRGTDFRVSYSEDQKAATAEVLKGAVGVDGKDGGVGLDAGFGARSDEQSAGKAIALLPPPEILSPVGHRRDGTLVFSFQKVEEALAYRLVLAGDPDFRDLRSETTSKTPQAVVPPLPNGTYYIRATVIDVHGLEGLSADIPYDHHIAIPGDLGRKAPATGG